MLKNNDEFKINSPIFNFLYRLSHSVLTYFWGILLEGISVFVGLIFDVYGKYLKEKFYIVTKMKNFKAELNGMIRNE